MKLITKYKWKATIPTTRLPPTSKPNVRNTPPKQSNYPFQLEPQYIQQDPPHASHTSALRSHTNSRPHSAQHEDQHPPLLIINRTHVPLAVIPPSPHLACSMKFSTLLLAVFATAVAAEPCTSKAPPAEPTAKELCTKICAADPIQDCGRGWVSGGR